MIGQPLDVRPQAQEDHWIPLADLMTGLMMIFMLVALAFMIQVQREAKKIEKQAAAVKEVAQDYTDLRSQLYKDLYAQFKNDLPIWNAVLSPDLSLRFKEPDVQFDTGSTIVKPSFSHILDSFFPRYVAVLYSPKYRASIEEIRIEGYTSSTWEKLSPEQAYYENMRLSQDRTRAVLKHVLALNPVRENSELYWLIRRLTANGLSSSKPIFTNGIEDQKLSQRVEFRVRTNADDRFEKILKSPK